MSPRTTGAGPLFDMFDQFGHALAMGIDHTAASRRMEELMLRPDWVGDIIIRSQRAKPMPALGERLWLVSDGLDQAGPVTVHVRGPFGFFGLTLEQALACIDQFHRQDQHRLRAGIERYFGVGPDQVDHTRHTTMPAPARRTTKRTEKESA
jgi:hypothetical protein